MSNIKEPWFVIERSEALAGLLLTSRDDVSIEKEYKQDDGVDFLVGINTGEPLSTKAVRRPSEGRRPTSNPNDWMQTVKQLFPENGRPTYFPRASSS